MSSSQKLLLVFIWHHPADIEFAYELADELRNHGLEVFVKDQEHKTSEGKFNTAGWQMAKSDCVIFMLSGAIEDITELRGEAEKVMRQGSTLAIPVLVDDNGVREIPLILRFIRLIDFHRDRQKAVGEILEEVQRHSQGKPGTLREEKRLWAKPFRWGIEHFRRYLTLPPLTFCWQITVENLIVSLLITGLVMLIFQPPTRTNLESLSASTFLWLVIILGPIFETVLLQVLPVFIARLLGLRFFGQILFSVTPFALLHFTRSVGAGIGAGIVGGFYSAFTYVYWRKKSLWTAYWVTALSHCLYNLAVFAMLIGDY